MSTFQDLLDDIGLLVGGTAAAYPAVGGVQQPADAVGFWSGAVAGDHTGLSDSGLDGCYSRPPESVETWPVGLVLPGPFTIKHGAVQAHVDRVRLVILVASRDQVANWATMNPLRDAVPAAFNAHYTLATLPGAVPLNPPVARATCGEGRPIVFPWGLNWIAWDFTISVERNVIGAAYSP